MFSLGQLKRMKKDAFGIRMRLNICRRHTSLEICLNRSSQKKVAPATLLGFLSQAARIRIADFDCGKVKRILWSAK